MRSYELQLSIPNAMGVVICLVDVMIEDAIHGRLKLGSTSMHLLAQRREL